MNPHINSARDRIRQTLATRNEARKREEEAEATQIEALIDRREEIRAALHSLLADPTAGAKPLDVIQNKKKELAEVQQELRTRIEKQPQATFKGFPLKSFQLDRVSGLTEIQHLQVDLYRLLPPQKKLETSGVVQWSATHLEQTRNNTAYLCERLLDSINGRPAGDPSPLLNVFAGLFRKQPAVSVFEATLDMIAEDFSLCEKMSRLNLEFINANKLVIGDEVDKQANDARERVKVHEAQLWKFNIIGLEYGLQRGTLQVLNTLSDMVKHDISNVEHSQEQAVACADVLLTMNMNVLSLISDLASFFKKNHTESSSEDVFAVLTRYEAEAEQLADKYQAYSSMLPEAAAKDAEQSLSEIANSLLALNRFVKLELDKRGYKPSELPVATPQKTGLQQQLVEQATSSKKSKKQKASAGGSNNSSVQPDSSAPAEIISSRRKQLISQGLERRQFEEEHAAMDSEPLDPAYFPALNRQLKKNIEDSAENRSEAIVKYREEALAKARNAQIKAREKYDLNQLGKIDPDDLKTWLKQENQELTSHELNTETLISALEKQMRKESGDGKKSELQEKIDRIRDENSALQVEASLEQFPNKRAVDLLLKEGALSLKAVGQSKAPVKQDEKTGLYYTTEIYLLEFNKDHPLVGDRKGRYGEAHTHPVCDEHGKILLDQQRRRQYIDRLVFNADGKLERVEKAMHLKHPSQARYASSDTEDNVHRFSLSVYDFQRMLERSSAVAAHR